MSLITISGTRNAIQIRRECVMAHLPCHSAVVRISAPNQPAISIYAVFSHPCWLIGATGKSATEQVESSEYSVAVDDDAAVEIETDDGDRTELF